MQLSSQTHQRLGNQKKLRDSKFQNLVYLKYRSLLLNNEQKVTKSDRNPRSPNSKTLVLTPQIPEIGNKMNTIKEKEKEADLPSSW